jgi:magnesium chelatase accessory protein
MALHARNGGGPLGRLPNTRLLVGIGAALLPWQGLPGKWFGPLARGLASLGPVPKWFAGWANKPAVLQSLVDSTGSTLSDESLALWERLGQPSRNGSLSGLTRLD